MGHSAVVDGNAGDGFGGAGLQLGFGHVLRDGLFLGGKGNGLDWFFFLAGGAPIGLDEPPPLLLYHPHPLRPILLRKQVIRRLDNPLILFNLPLLPQRIHSLKPSQMPILKLIPLPLRFPHHLLLHLPIIYLSLPSQQSLLVDLLRL